MKQTRALLEALANGGGQSIDRELAERLIEIAQAVVLLLDSTGRVVFYNRFLERLSGIALDEARGQDWFSTFLPERDHERIRSLFGRAIAGEPVVNNLNAIRTREGDERLIEWCGSVLRGPQGETLGLLSLGIDVTERARLERDTKVQAQLVQDVSDAIIAVDPEGRIESWNQAAEVIYGFSADEAVGQPMTDLVATETSPQARAQAMEHLQAHGTWRGEYVHHRKDGSPVYVQAQVSVVRDADGAVRGLVAVNRDTSAEVEAKRRLRESERRYRAIFEQTHQLAGVLATDGTLLDANQRSLDAVGVAREQVIGRPFCETAWWSHSPELQRRLNDAIARAAMGQTVRFEAEHPRVDGTMATVDFSIRPIFDEHGKVELLIPESVDITQQRRLQQELLERQRLAAIGTTASMFAHEIANPLNNMTLQGRLLAGRLQRIGAGDDISITLDRLLDEVRRLSALLGEFRALAQRQRIEFEPTDLKALVNEVIQLHVVPAGAAFRIEQAFPEDMPTIAASPDKLKQVLINLCKNALEAMPEGGVLRIEGAFGEDAVRLCVCDTGTGIPPGLDVLQPFESTKAGGTGLGLPIAREIVRAHGGELRYTSQLGRGTTFEVELPRRSPSTQHGRAR